MFLEMIKFMVKFKFKNLLEELNDFFFIYWEIVNYFISYVFENNVMSFYRFKKEIYKSFCKEYLELLSYYYYIVI